jgi:hypothetical protein
MIAIDSGAPEAPDLPRKTEHTGPAMEVAVIGEFLKPHGVKNLVRLGRDYDGGYLVDARTVSSADFLLSLGINDDWSFERDFRKTNACPIYAFDGTISRKKFLKNVIKSIPRIDNPRVLINHVRTYLDYNRFFSESARHIPALVGFDRPPEFLSLASVFATYVPESARNVFLKIDIEGSEYRILDELVNVSDRVCGMAIEFHNVDLHQERIRDFIQRVNLKVCHVHCNNFEPTTGNGTPLVIEVSLTRFEVDDRASLQWPNALDMPNDKLKSDYRIQFTQ